MNGKGYTYKKITDITYSVPARACSKLLMGKTSETAETEISVP